MFRTPKAVVAIALAGRHLIGGSRFPVHCSWGRWYTAHGVTTLEEVKNNVDEGYSQKQRGIILHILNTATESQLNCVIRPQGVQPADIMHYREVNGPFPNLNVLCQALGAEPATVHQLCKSILSLRANNKPHVVAKFLKPDIHLSELQAAQSIVSVVFGLKKLAWAHVDHKKTVRDWQQLKCFEFPKGGYATQLYLEALSEVVTQLPQADYYILEQPYMSLQKSSLFPVVLHCRTVEATLYSLLNSQILEKHKPQVFSMNRASVGKHFGLMIGPSKTSGVDVVQRLIEEATAIPNPRVILPPELLHKNLSQGQSRQEEMCDALLQAITFYELVQF